MKIKYLKRNLVPIKSLNDGEVFRYKNEIYIRFGGQHFHKQFNCLLLKNGILFSVPDDCDVEVLDAELIIRN